MAHDFVNFPELANSQMLFYYSESPHRQITEDFHAKVVKVHDGDTITLRWSERDFDFPLRLLDIDAPELNEGGEDAQQWLENKILDKEVDIKIDRRQRVGKWGRLLGKVISGGFDMGETMLNLGIVGRFGENTGEIKEFTGSRIR